MNAPKRRHSVYRRALALFCPLLSLSLIAASAAAQDYGHMRVQFSHGSAWTDAAPRADAAATQLPPGPAHAGYGYAHNAESGAPSDRVRLKAPSYSGM
jgi:hypothetical protein